MEKAYKFCSCYLAFIKLYSQGGQGNIAKINEDATIVKTKPPLKKGGF